MENPKEEVLPRPGVYTLSKWQLLLNFLVAHFWIGPVVTVYWVCTWQLIVTVLIWPSHQYISIWISFVIAVGVVSVASCLQVQLNKLANAYGRVWREVCSHVYIYVLAFASVNQWRCFWQGWDLYTGTATSNGIVTFFCAFFVLALLGCTSKLMASPSMTVIDLPRSTFFVMTTWGNTEPGTVQHVLDSVFTSSFLPFLVATSWRGIWVLCDNHLSPDDVTLSGVYCLVIAYGLATVLMLTRAQWMKLSVWAERKHWVCKFVVEDFHTLLQTIAAATHWRGFWKILIAHVVFDEEWRYWLGHVLSLVVVWACFASKTLLTTGCDRDGVHSNGMGIDLNIYYVASLRQWWKQKKYDTLHEDNDGTSPTTTHISDLAGKKDGQNDEQLPVLSHFNASEKPTLYLLKE